VTIFSEITLKISHGLQRECINRHIIYFLDSRMHVTLKLNCISTASFLNHLFSWELETVTGYGLDDRGVGVRVPVGSRIFSSPRRSDRF
jgi:hypothetical protein